MLYVTPGLVNVYNPAPVPQYLWWRVTPATSTSSGILMKSNPGNDNPTLSRSLNCVTDHGTILRSHNGSSQDIANLWTDWLRFQFYYFDLGGHFLRPSYGTVSQISQKATPYNLICWKLVKSFNKSSYVFLKRNSGSKLFCFEFCSWFEWLEISHWKLKSERINVLLI